MYSLLEYLQVYTVSKNDVIVMEFKVQIYKDWVITGEWHFLIFNI